MFKEINQKIKHIFKIYIYLVKICSISEKCLNITKNKPKKKLLAM